MATATAINIKSKHVARKSGDIVKHYISTQGAILVNYAYVHEWGNDVCAIAVDMRSKRGEIISDGCDDDNLPMVIVEAVEESVHLKRGVDRMAPTVIVFPQFKGWTVWASNISKYTIYICLVNIKK